jgi:hypothetical protein
LRKVGQSKKKIKSSRLKRSKHKVGKIYKKGGPPNWWTSLIDEVYSFTSLGVFRGMILNRDANQKVLTVLCILYKLMFTYFHPDDLPHLNKCRELYEKIINKPFPFIPWKPPKDFPSLDGIQVSDGIRFLKVFYYKQKPLLFAQAVKFGLFEELCFEALKLSVHFKYSSELEHVPQEIKDFAELVYCALFPIVRWRKLAAGKWSDPTSENEDVKMYLDKIGESLNPGKSDS